jgi:hypothetical protein
MAIAPWIAPAVLAEYVHNAGIRIRRHVLGHTRHHGSADRIIRSCIDACWNSRTFTASPGHFDMFWTRDLSFSVPSLIRLGEGERVHASLAYALDVWTRRRKHITTTIHYFDQPGDVYDYGVDSLPLLMAALRSADAIELVERHAEWLEAEIGHFYRMVVDPATGLVRGDRAYSAHRDTCVNRSNTYGNTMVALLAKTIQETGWFASPFERHFQGAYDRLLVEHLWDGDHFRDAVGDDTVSGEANIWPFYAGVASDPSMIGASLRYLDANGFCDPFPLRYETRRRPEREVWITRYVLPDYQGTTVWTSLGAMYLQVLRTVDPALARWETARYVDWIERDGTYWEVMDHHGRGWVSRNRIMVGEESMLWSAIFLDHLENDRVAPAYLSEPIPAAAEAIRVPRAPRRSVARCTRTTARLASGRRVGARPSPGRGSEPARRR